MPVVSRAIRKQEAIFDAVAEQFTDGWRAEVFRLWNVEAGIGIANQPPPSESFETFQHATTLTPRSTVQKAVERRISFLKR